MDERIRILIIDDDADQLQLTRTALEDNRHAFDIYATQTTESCLKLLREHRIQVVLLDGCLQEIDGLTVVESINAAEPTVAAVLLTTEWSEKTAVAALKAGAVDCIVKEPGYLQRLPVVVRKAAGQKKLQMQLDSATRRFQHLFRHSRDAVLVLSADTQSILEANARAEALFGVPRTVLAGQSLLSFCADQSRAALQQFLTAAQQAAVPASQHFLMRRKPPETWDAEMAITSIMTDAGRILQCIIQDVTHKRQLGQQSFISMANLQTLFDGIEEMVSVQDRDFNIVLANRQFAEWRGTPPEALVGQKCYAAYFERESACEECPLPRTFSGASPQTVEMEQRGEWLHIRTYLTAAQDEQGAYAVEQIRLGTEQKKLQEQLIRSDRLATIGILSSGIAHELRNPLNIIEAARYYLAHAIPDSERDLQAKLSIIRINIQRASKIIKNLLEFSRKSAVARERLDVNYLLESTLGLIEKELRVNDVIIIRDFDDEVVGEFQADGLRQIFLNLLLNALEAMPDGGELRIRSRRRGTDVEVEFADSGTGIAPENLDKIFSPFFTTKPVGKGTGLGLYIAHSIAAQHGGAIEVNSEPGVGTTFRVLFPDLGSQPGARIAGEGVSVVSI